MNDVVVAVVLVLMLGVGAQWAAQRLGLPSILLLLITGFVAGPVTGILSGEMLTGDVLFTFVSLSVAVILFEGGLTLRISELSKVGTVVTRLMTLGIAVTWIVGSVAAYYLFDFEMGWPLAILLGAILTVTGPTVVGPLLRQIRPTGPSAAALKWEGILIDPAGAILAVLIFEALLAGVGLAAGDVFTGLLRTLLAGLVIGLGAGVLLIVVLRRYWIPDALRGPVALMFVIVAFAMSNVWQPESGLLTVTVMGILVANESRVAIQSIMEFKESLQVLLIGTLFILLAARTDLGSLLEYGWAALVFPLILILVARPLSVWVSTIGTDMSRADRIFLAWMAPRGIVAAAVATLFAFELVEHGLEEADALVSITLLVIIVTVTFYGLTAGPVARRLGLAERDPQGLLIIGAHPMARGLAKAVGDLGYRVVLLDSNAQDVAAARREGLEAVQGNALAEGIFEDLDFAGLGRLLAMTRNDEANALAALHFREVFGRAGVYQLPAEGEASEGVPTNLRGRALFGREATVLALAERERRGAKVQVEPIEGSLDLEVIRAYEGADVMPLCVVSETGRLHVLTQEQRRAPRSGTQLISYLVPGHSAMDAMARAEADADLDPEAGAEAETRAEGAEADDALGEGPEV